MKFADPFTWDGEATARQPLADIGRTRAHSQDTVFIGRKLNDPLAAAHIGVKAPDKDIDRLAGDLKRPLSSFPGIAPNG